MKAKYLAADFEARLNGGVVLYKGIPHRVLIDEHQINLADLLTSRTVIRDVPPLDENLDISAPELGFMNRETHAVYLERMPRRLYRQSLESRSVVETCLYREGPIQEVPNGRGNAIYSKDFLKMFTEPYPTFDQAVAKLTAPDSEVLSIAVSRMVALTSDDFGRITVWYKGRMGDAPVGWVDPGSRVVRVPSTDKAWVISIYLSELGWEVV